MKKIILSAIMVFSSIIAINAQDDDTNTSSANVSYGVKAGYNSFVARASVGGNSASVSESGFYFGIFADFMI